MATTSKTIDMKLQVRVEDASSGTSKVKNLNFSKIKVSKPVTSSILSQMVKKRKRPHLATLKKCASRHSYLAFGIM